MVFAKLFLCTTLPFASEIIIYVCQLQHRPAYTYSVHTLKVRFPKNRKGGDASELEALEGTTLGTTLSLRVDRVEFRVDRGSASSSGLCQTSGITPKLASSSRCVGLEESGERLRLEPLEVSGGFEFCFLKGPF